jgi:hypothetical protein
MRPPTGTPCRECPFRRKSLAGYTGAASVEDFAAAAYQGEIPLPCHLAVDYEDPDWKRKLDRAPQCSGHAITLTNSCKSPRNKEVQLLPADHVNVFSFQHEFLNHHFRLDQQPVTKKPKKRGKRA